MESPSQEKLDAAIDFATAKHRGQYRDGDAPLPYITHPLDVLANLRYTGDVTDPELLVTAVLHDVVEECEVDPEEIEQKFGQRVRKLVDELTREEPDTTGMDPDARWELRSKLLLEEIERMSPDAQQVKLADRLSNLDEARRVKNGKKLQRYNKQTARILEIIPRTVNPGLWDALRQLQIDIG